jgi:transcription antitermination factor NusG
MLNTIKPGMPADRVERWYAVYTRHQHEKVVADVIARKGIEVFLPTYEVHSRWADRTKILQRPLFPCYVFVQADVRMRRLAILETAGVHFIVGGGRPEEIPAREIESIKRAIDNQFSCEPFPFLSVGDRVRIKAGPLEGIEGFLVRKKNDYRLVLSVEMLQKSVAVEIDGYLAERIGPRSRALTRRTEPTMALW